ncbi:hypothetical protein Pcinc_019432 [Petrolisthes cinctipes]|uniref:Uncharacterized protein n=1 Tax=Petrolisthes cinctipes TaxID=88211 RepID=A0AAE1FK38_PETCI|nr:hypothetical protein Pcinc_019432 [Petrolisthes cinctipes]
MSGSGVQPRASHDGGDNNTNTHQSTSSLTLNASLSSPLSNPNTNHHCTTCNQIVLSGGSVDDNTRRVIREELKEINERQKRVSSLIMCDLDCDVTGPPHPAAVMAPSPHCCLGPLTPLLSRAPHPTAVSGPSPHCCLGPLTPLLSQDPHPTAVTAPTLYCYIPIFHCGHLPVVVSPCAMTGQMEERQVVYQGKEALTDLIHELKLTVHTLWVPDINFVGVMNVELEETVPHWNIWTVVDTTSSNLSLLGLLCQAKT